MADKKPSLLTAACLWRDGCDTTEIGKRLGIAEWVVWRQLDRIKHLAGADRMKHISDPRLTNPFPAAVAASIARRAEA